jgi:hypothetical protein
MSGDARMLRVNLILHLDNRGWIIEKIAERLTSELPRLGATATISYQADRRADVNHYMSYAFAEQPLSTPTSMLVTHLDDPFKVAQVKRQLGRTVDLGVCLSGDTVRQLTGAGVSADRLCFVVPGHDGVSRAKPITVGITTRVYADGRKREKLLSRLSRDLDLSGFRFEIFGSGWDEIVRQLTERGVEVHYDRGSADYAADYRRVLERLPFFDYYLYMGLDEGSLGTLDALAAGVRTIVTAQGFHLEVANALTHTFTEYAELLQIFRRIQEDRSRRISAAATLTWQRYARHHALIWRTLAAGRRGQLTSILERERATDATHAGETTPQSPGAGARYVLRVLSPRRILSAIGRTAAVRPLRDAVRRRLR